MMSYVKIKCQMYPTSCFPSSQVGDSIRLLSSYRLLSIVLPFASSSFLVDDTDEDTDVDGTNLVGSTALGITQTRDGSMFVRNMKLSRHALETQIAPFTVDNVVCNTLFSITPAKSSKLNKL